MQSGDIMFLNAVKELERLRAEIPSRLPADCGLPGAGREASVYLYIGNESITPYHYDEEDTFFIQLHGTKTIIHSSYSCTLNHDHE